MKKRGTLQACGLNHSIKKGIFFWQNRNYLNRTGGTTSLPPPFLGYAPGTPFKLLSNFTEITIWHGCFPVGLLHIFRTSFLKNTFGRLLLNLNPTASSLKIQTFIFILLQEFWNYMQFDLLVTILYFYDSCTHHIKYYDGKQK